MKAKDELLQLNDPVLQKIAASIPRPQIISTQNVFHDLMSCVIEQQIHYRSTKKTFQKMLQQTGLQQLTPENFYLFEQHAFSGRQFSAAKYETIHAVLNFWQQNSIHWQALDDAAVAEKLSGIKGIGKWTVDMVLLYTLQRTNVFPYDDFHLKQIMVAEYGLDAKAKLKTQMLEVAENWGAHKSLAVLYLLAWKSYLKRGR